MTEGSELKHIILFTLPLFAGNVFQQLYNIVDSIIVGKFLGSDKLAAVGTTGSLTYLFSTLCIGYLSAPEYSSRSDSVQECIRKSRSSSPTPRM